MIVALVLVLVLVLGLVLAVVVLLSVLVSVPVLALVLLYRVRRPPLKTQTQFRGNRLSNTISKAPKGTGIGATGSKTPSAY